MSALGCCLLLHPAAIFRFLAFCIQISYTFYFHSLYHSHFNDVHAPRSLSVCPNICGRVFLKAEARCSPGNMLPCFWEQYLHHAPGNFLKAVAGSMLACWLVSKWSVYFLLQSFLLVLPSQVGMHVNGAPQMMQPAQILGGVAVPGPLGPAGKREGGAVWDSNTKLKLDERNGWLKTRLVIAVLLHSFS